MAGNLGRSVNAANNRLSTSDNYAFDNAGNTTADAEGRTFVYDAENKQTSVSDPGGTVGQYFYDGDGKRVKKTASGDNTVFVYDAAGQLIEEYSGPTLQIAYVYAGSRLLSTETSAGTNYLTNDHLGSPRINTDQSGTVTARHDYHPFGEEIARSGYGADTVRKQFTGYERDIESNLDYAINRYYNGGHGRFSSVDPYNIILEMEKGRDVEEKQKIFVGYISQPQIWNKYVYSINNPLNLSDPDGRRPLTQGEKDQLKQFREMGYAYSVERMNSDDPNRRWTAEQAEAFRHRVDQASQVIENAILAVPD